MSVENRKIIVVLGMHRSGTSAMTKALQALGVELGDNLMPPADSNNETGFFEDLDINRLNVELLKELGYSWSSNTCITPEELTALDLPTYRQRAAELLRNKLESCTYFGLKDPRICRLLPFWQQVFADLGLQVGYLIASRNPISVAHSLNRRDGFEMEKGHLLWQEHMLNALLLTQEATRLVVDYDQLLGAPEVELTRIAERFKLTFDPASEGSQTYLRDFLQASLRHALNTPEELLHSSEISPPGKALYSLLLRLAADDCDVVGMALELRELTRQQQALGSALQLLDKEEGKVRSYRTKADQQAAQLQEKSVQLRERNRQLQEKSVQLRERDHQTRRLEARNSALIAEILQYKHSTSWRITAPLRRGAALARKLKSLPGKLQHAVERAGGPGPALHKLVNIYRAEGHRGILLRLRFYRMNHTPIGHTWPGRDFALASAAQPQLLERIASNALQAARAEPGHVQAREGSRLKLAVAVHIFYPELWPEIARRLRNLPFDFDLFITTSAECRQSLQAQLANDALSAEIIEVANRGYDLLPFLQLLPRLQEGGYDLVCKVHSKKGSANLELLHPELGNLWLDLLLDPLMGTPQVARDAIQAFEQDPLLGMLGSADLYKSAARLMYGNEVHIARQLERLAANTDPAQDWGFFAGSMFWARLDTLLPLLQLEPLLQEQNDAPAKTGEHASPWHALERSLGLLPRLAGMRTALSYARDLQRESYVISSAGQPLASPYGIGLSLVAESRIQQYHACLSSLPGFDAGYYSSRTPEAAALGMEPLVHFLRYGIQHNQCPSAGFSPGLYWDEHRDVLHGRHNALVHYLTHGRNEKRACFPAADNDLLIRELISKSGQFDAKYYMRNNHEVPAARSAPLQHFCQKGHLELRKPGPQFDLEWYRSQYLSNFITPVNPLLHFAICGNQRKLTTRPSDRGLDLLGRGLRYPAGKQPRRACLFASYDPNGLIDDYVVDYLRALQRHADIYFLSDAQLPASELQKLNGLVKGAWAVRHGEYDFGSYSRLARFYVGWETLKQYDEVILANDSCYLLHSLDELFGEMDKRQCDWWGLQATKGLSATRHVKSNSFDKKIPLTEVKKKLLSSYERDDFYDFHIGSYFLVFRQPVLQEGSLARLLDGAKKQPNKKAIIQAYEIGLTRTLINRKFEFDTFIDSLHPFHPLYTERHFDLVAEGMPLFKRFFLSENHYFVPELWRWKERLQALLPGLDTAPFEKNLARVVPADKLYKSLHIPATQQPSSQQELLDSARFLDEDSKVEKHDNWWAFPVCAYDHSLSGNDRAVFEEVRHDPHIKKVVLTRSKDILLEGENIEILPLQSRQGQERLMRCKYIFVKHTPRENALYPLRADLHRFINLWHGIPLKRIGYASLDLKDKLASVADQHSRCHSVISSSKIDRLAMASAFYPLSFHHIWLTGLPRNDFILRQEDRLPGDLQDDLKRLEQQLAGKRLVLFAPTFRNSQADGAYCFSQDEKQRLSRCLNQHNALLGIREHMADTANSYSSELQDVPMIQLGNAHFSNIEMLYRQSDVLITDYSSCFIDFMLTGKQQICFAFDLESYAQSERGLFYDLETVFPGPICQDFENLLQALDHALTKGSAALDPDYTLKRKIFFDYIDDSNAARVVEHVKAEFLEGASA
ncbi:MAG: rhamnan synthesis F family protein [Pseudomonas sp.]